jgi:hypothetical protein
MCEDLFLGSWFCPPSMLIFAHMLVLITNWLYSRPWECQFSNFVPQYCDYRYLKSQNIFVLYVIDLVYFIWLQCVKSFNLLSLYMEWTANQLWMQENLVSPKVTTDGSWTRHRSPTSPAHTCDDTWPLFWGRSQRQRSNGSNPTPMKTDFVAPDLQLLEARGNLGKGNIPCL